MRENRLFDLKNLELDPKMKILSAELPQQLTLLNLEDNSLIKLEFFHAVCLDLILKKTNDLDLIQSLNQQFFLDEPSCSIQIGRLITFLIDKGVVKRS